MGANMVPIFFAVHQSYFSYLVMCTKMISPVLGGNYRGSSAEIWQRFSLRFRECDQVWGV